MIRPGQVRDSAKIALTRSPRLYDAARRPYALGRFFARRPHDPDYAVFAHFADRTGVFLDVGANAGMSALSFRIYNRTAPIISIEPNPFHERDLRFVSRFVEPFSYRMWAAGDALAHLTLHVPHFRGVPLTTEASLDLESVMTSPSLRERLGDGIESSHFTVEARTVPVRPLDDLDAPAAFVKLDVQGAEETALLGLERTVRTQRPILLIETPEEEVRDLLDDWDYLPFTYDAEERRLTTEGSGVNTVFLPSELRRPARLA